MRAKCKEEHRDTETKRVSVSQGLCLLCTVSLDKKKAVSHLCSFLFANPIWFFNSPGTNGFHRQEYTRPDNRDLTLWH